jgi:formylglycine-generating enzyme required for sulfatase activity
MTLLDVVAFAYLEALLCVFVMELYPRGRLAHAAALASIVFVAVGGAAWSYAAYFEPSAWPVRPPLAPIVRSVTPPQAVAAPDGREAGEAEAKENSIETVGRAAHVATAADEIETVSDCDLCPPLIAVPAGEAMIGADEHDTEATAVERPQVQVRFWPGFLIAAAPVSKEVFQAFLTETRRARSACGAQTADLAPPLLTPDPLAKSGEPASCVTPADADAFADWLTARTGKRFRLPSAAAWEYAARVVPGRGLVRGNVAEIVADCWHEQVPPPGKERFAAETASISCDGRMLKGAGALESARWHRLSARRRFGAGIAGSDVGFRVMRALDGVH